MSSNITPDPTPPFNNPPINPQYYQPSVFSISDIVLGTTTLITTTQNHNYVIGQLCRLLIPPTFGTIQLNEVQGMVILIPQINQVVLDVYSIDMNSFISNPEYKPTLPQIVAVGDYNSGIISTTGKVHPHHKYSWVIH